MLKNVAIIVYKEKNKRWNVVLLIALKKIFFWGIMNGRRELLGSH
jgi:hypothetical protein